MRYLNAAQRVKATVMELVFVLIDFSASMDTEDFRPSRKAGAIEANKRLIETKARAFPDDQLGIIVFSDNAKVLHRPVPVGSGSQALCKSLRKRKIPGGGTNFTAALELAERCLFGSYSYDEPQSFFGKAFSEFLAESETDSLLKISTPNVDNGITRRIIMLTDGEHNGDGDPAKVAGRLKKAGVIVECIGVAGSPGEVDKKMLKRIASRDEAGKARYSFIGDTSQLIKKYESMANQIRPV